MRFCRRICPGPPMLVPSATAQLRAPGVRHLRSRAPSGEAASLRSSRTSLYDLALASLVIIGHGERADSGARLALHHGWQLEACILLRPMRPLGRVLRRLNGLVALLCMAPRDRRPASVYVLQCTEPERRRRQACATA